jgi:hypothetical protein
MFVGYLERLHTGLKLKKIYPFFIRSMLPTHPLKLRKTITPQKTGIEVSYGSHLSFSPPTPHASVSLAFRSNGQARLPLGNDGHLFGCAARAGVDDRDNPILVPPDLSDGRNQLHVLYGHA